MSNLKLTRYFLLLTVLLLVPTFTHAATYYFSTATGDDTRTATQAQSSATPWKSITKLNSYFSTLQPGDSVLFNRGETFYGGILVTKSGTSSLPITIGAYGSGAKPVITGLSSATGFTSVGTNLWESASITNGGTTVMKVLINGTAYAMGRYPNPNATKLGWLTYETFSGATSITDTDGLSATPNWTGAEVVLRKNAWTIDRAIITSHVGGTLTFANSHSDNGINGFSYFIQNDLRTLDQQGEWYYNPITKRITVYSTSAPSSVQVSTVSSLVDGGSKSYVTFSNLDFRGSNNNTFNIPTTNYITILNSTISHPGENAINGVNNTKFFTIENSTISDSNTNGIYCIYCHNLIVRNNSFINTGMYPGMLSKRSNGSTFEGVVIALSNNVLIENNRFINTGYIGVSFNRGSNNIIRKNFFDNFNVWKNDGSAIYTSGDMNGDPLVDVTRYINNLIESNIIINGSSQARIGYNDEKNRSGTNGIYLDQKTLNTTVKNNSISGVNKSGIYHSVTGQNNSIIGNTIFTADSLVRIHRNQAGGIIQNDPPMNLTLSNNILVSSGVGPRNWPYYYVSSAADSSTNVTGNNNIFARPLDNLTHISEVVNNGTTFCRDPISGTWNYSLFCGETKYDINSWKIKYQTRDQNSTTSPITTTNASDLRFEYNDTTSNKTISLGANYIDMKNVAYNGSITLPPFTSAVLIKTGISDTTIPSVSLIAPTAGATLSGTATLSATATDNVAVTTVNFFQGTTLISADTVAPYTTTWNTTLVPNGTYILKAIAADAAGNTASTANVSVTVSNITNDLGVTLSTPVAGTTVSGTIAVTAIPTGSTIARVDFYKDTDTTPFATAVSSFTVFFDTTTLIDGARTLKAIVYNTSGGSATSSLVEVLVNNGTVPRPVGTPSAPQSVLAQAGNARARLSWTPPVLLSGESAITAYTIVSTPGNITTTASTSPVIVTGLTNGTAYTFTVRANNSAGAGEIATTSVTTPSTSFPIGSTVQVVAGGRLNVRSTPNGSKIGSVSNGEVGTVLANSAGWTQVQFSTVKGWVSNIYLFVQSNSTTGGGQIITNPTTPSTSFPIGSTVQVVVGGRLNVRSTPNGLKIGSVSNGEVGTVLAKSAGWTQVQFSTVKGWVSNIYLFAQ